VNNTILNRIIVDSAIMTGKPIIKGTRLTVQHILGLLAQGMTTEDIIQEYKNIKQEDILACLMFAQQTVDSTFFAPLAS